MKYYTTVLLLLLPQLAFAAAGVADVAGEDPGLFLVMMAMLAAFAGVLLAASLLLALLTGIVLSLAGMGIFSVSVLTAWYHRSFTKGAQTFFRLCFIAAGSLSGAAIVLILSVAHAPYARSILFDLSVIAGGGAAGWISYAIAEKMISWMIAKKRLT